MGHTAIAIILSLLAPGAGQVYNGHYFKATAFAVIYAMLMTVIFPLFIRIFKITDIQKMLAAAKTFNIIVICAVLISVADAGISAWFKAGVTKTDIIASLIYVFAVVTIHKNLKNAFLITALSGNGLISDIVLGTGKFSAVNTNK